MPEHLNVKVIVTSLVGENTYEIFKARKITIDTRYPEPPPPVMVGTQVVPLRRREGPSSISFTIEGPLPDEDGKISKVIWKPAGRE